MRACVCVCTCVRDVYNEKRKDATAGVCAHIRYVGILRRSLTKISHVGLNIVYKTAIQDVYDVISVIRLTSHLRW